MLRWNFEDALSRHTFKMVALKKISVAQLFIIRYMQNSPLEDNKYDDISKKFLTYQNTSKSKMAANLAKKSFSLWNQLISQS